MKRPAFYAPIGNVKGDLVAILHPPYTAWHLSHVGIGAALAATIDWKVLLGTLLAFFFGLGIAAHALDEAHGRPLRTSLGDGLLWLLGVGGMVAALVVAVIGAVVISPVVLAWAAAGVILATGYSIERPAWLHRPLGFALAWGAFPVLVGYWAQTETISLGSAVVAGAATLVSLAQRALSTPARHVRRDVDQTEIFLTRGEVTERWDEQEVLATWEQPLRLLAWAMVTLAVGLLAAKAG